MELVRMSWQWVDNFVEMIMGLGFWDWGFGIGVLGLGFLGLGFLGLGFWEG